MTDTQEQADNMGCTCYSSGADDNCPRHSTPAQPVQGLCDTHTGGPHPIEHSCKDWQPVQYWTAWQARAELGGEHRKCESCEDWKRNYLAANRARAEQEVAWQAEIWVRWAGDKRLVLCNRDAPGAFEIVKEAQPIPEVKP